MRASALEVADVAPVDAAGTPDVAQDAADRVGPVNGTERTHERRAAGDCPVGSGRASALSADRLRLWPDPSFGWLTRRQFSCRRNGIDGYVKPKSNFVAGVDGHCPNG